jgi:hypothetical protein
MMKEKYRKRGDDALKCLNVSLVPQTILFFVCSYNKDFAMKKNLGKWDQEFHFLAKNFTVSR